MTIERRIRILDKVEFGQRFKAGEMVLLKGEGNNPTTLISGTVIDDDTLEVRTSIYDDSLGYPRALRGIPTREYFCREAINEYNLQDPDFQIPGVTRSVVWKPSK